MKQLILFFSLLSLSIFATTYTTTVAKVSTTDTMYSYTYRNNTQVCAVDIFVPKKGKIKVEKICYKI